MNVKSTNRYAQDKFLTFQRFVSRSMIYYMKFISFGLVAGSFSLYNPQRSHVYVYILLPKFHNK